MTTLGLAVRFSVAGGLGLVLGLERERSQIGEKTFAGARSFALLALLGTAGAFFHAEYGLTALLVTCFAAVGGLVTVSYVVTTRDGHVGATTEIAALLTFVVGCLCGLGDLSLAAGLGVGTLLILSIKGWSRDLARRIESPDVEAALKFAVITVIILPLLPNRTFGPAPLNVLNPYKIWLMVVLISGLNFLSYILVKVVGQEHGIGLTGILGGLVSSTAVTLGFSQRSRKEPSLAAPLCLGILLAWTVMFVRVPVMVTLVNAGLGRRLALGLGVMAAASLGACAFLFWRNLERGKDVAHSGNNPFELSEAIKFGLLFGAVTFVAKAAQLYLGDAGLYLAGALAGLTDVDAISLSMANLAGNDPGSAVPAARTILIAVITNTLVKAGMAVGMGAPELQRRILPVVLLLLGAGAVAIFLLG